MTGSPAPMMTYQQLAELLSVKPSTLRSWVQRGVGPPALRLGPRTTRFARTAVDAWLASNVYEPDLGQGVGEAAPEASSPPTRGCE